MSFGLPAGVMSALRAIRGRSKKVLVLDLDNTLWGGVVGDLGAGGIKLGQGSGEGEPPGISEDEGERSNEERPGNLFKNDDERPEPFENGDMILKFSDISCLSPIGITRQTTSAPSPNDWAQARFAGFVDDNPAEPAGSSVHARVAVPDLPEDPAGYVQRWPDTGISGPSPSHAKIRRGALCRERQRREMASQSVDIGSFLSSLAMP